MILLQLWQLPMTILVWGFYILPLWELNVIVLDGYYGRVHVFRPTGKWGWYVRAWDGWLGVGLPNCIILSEGVHGARESTKAHELRHVMQWRVLGVLFPVVYLAGMLVAYLRGRHPYRDSWLEVDAQRVASALRTPDTEVRDD